MIRSSKASPATTRRPRRAASRGPWGLAEEVSDISLACRQIGPVRFKEKFEQGDVVFSGAPLPNLQAHGRIVRGCDARRNTLVYMVYSDRPIEGSPEELDLERADHALGRGRRAAAEMRRLGEGVRHDPEKWLPVWEKIMLKQRGRAG